MTTRRKLLIALGAGVVWRPLNSVAQKARPMPVVGVLSLEVEDQVAHLKEGLHKLGYIEGRNIRLEERNAGDRYARLVEIANEFVALKADVIVTLGSTATLTARKATSTIPIVMVSGIDPVKEKLAASLSRPGGNVTGVSTILQDLSAKRLELAKEAVPGLSRVGIMWNPDSRASTLSLRDVQDAAKALNLQLQVVEARSAGDFDKAFETLAKSGITIFVLLNSSAFSANRKQLVESATRYRLTGVYSAIEYLSLGGLFSYGAIRSEAYRHAAVYVDKILKGAKPGDLPIEQPMRFEMAVNLKTAKALGLTLPSSIMVQATRVID